MTPLAWPSLAEVVHYIPLNPVRAKVVKAEQLLTYQWSSLPLFLSGKRSAWLVAETTLAESGALPDTKAGWQRYLAYLAVRAEEDARRREEKFGRLSRGWAIGSAEFRANLKQELAQLGAGQDRFELLGADRAAQREARTALWEEKLRVAAKALGVALNRLPAKKSAPEKVKLAALLKATTSVSNVWLAERLALGRPGSVTQWVRQFRLTGGADKREFKMALSIVHT
jgi:hypothetical protein